MLRKIYDTACGIDNAGVSAYRYWRKVASFANLVGEYVGIDADMPDIPFVSVGNGGIQKIVLQNIERPFFIEQPDGLLLVLRCLFGYQSVNSEIKEYMDLYSDVMCLYLQDDLKERYYPKGESLDWLQALGCIAEYDIMSRGFGSDRGVFPSYKSIGYQLYDTPYSFDRLGKMDIVYVPVLKRGFMLNDDEGRFLSGKVRFSPLYNVAFLYSKGKILACCMGDPRCKGYGYREVWVFNTDDYPRYLANMKKQLAYD